MRTIHIAVTQDDIDHGRRKDCARCPVARALHRATGAIFWVIGDFAIERPAGRALWLSDEVLHWILRFDARQPVEPMRFEVRV